MANERAIVFSAYYPQIYFLYGLALFAMGLALWLESRRTSQLSLGRAVRLMALFGLLHSAHEFWEMFGIIEGHPLSLWEHTAQTALLAVSFFPLIAFGSRLLWDGDSQAGLAARITILAIVAYVTQVVLIHTIYQCSWIDLILAAHGLARYTLGIPGALLAALGLLRQRRVLLEQNLRPFARDLGIAAGALVWYGAVGQVFTHKSVLFPSIYLNSELFEQWVGVPIQVIRAGAAIVAAVAMIRALRAFEEEHRRALKMTEETERELKAAAREVSLLYETSHLLTETNDLDALLQRAIDRLIQVIEPLEHGIILVPSLKDANTVHIASCGYAERADAAVTLIKSPAAASARWLDPFGNDVTQQIPQSPPASHHQIMAIRQVLLPLETNQRFVGRVMLETNPDGPFLSSLQAPTIIALVRQLTIAIENANLVLALRQREARRSELLQRATSAQEAERKRIARELHDETGQALTALGLGLKGMSKLIERNPDQAAKQVDQLLDISTGALEELRHLIADLRPSHLDMLGLVATLRWYIEQIIQRYPIRLELRTSGDACQLSPELETTLFRIAQEGLTNVIKHAGASQACVSVCFAPDQIEMEIRDEGQGFDTRHVLEPGAERAWGLVGIRERVALAGGRLDVKSTMGKGTTLCVRVPRQEIYEA